MLDVDVRRKVLAKSYEDSDGTIVRMKVRRVSCRTCRTMRWDDGTKCEKCGGYENPYIKPFVPTPGGGK